MSPEATAVIKEDVVEASSLDSILNPVVEDPAPPETKPADPPAPPEEPPVVMAPPEEPPKPLGEAIEDAVPSDVFKRANIPEEVVAEPVVPTDGTPTEEDVEIGKDAPPEVAHDEKAKNAWVKVKKHEKELLKQVDALKGKLTAAENKEVPEIAAIAGLQKKIDGYEETLGRVDLAQSKVFKQRYDNKLTAEFGRGVKMLVKAGHDQQEAQGLMAKLSNPTLTFEQTQLLLQDEPLTVQGALSLMHENIAEMQEQRAAALNDWKSTRAAQSEEEKRVSVADMSKAIVGDTQQAVSKLVEEGSWLFMESDVNGGWNDAVQERIKAVHGILKTAKPEELVKYVADGVASRTYRELYEKEQAKTKQLNTEFQKYLKAAPGVRAAGDTPSVEDKVETMHIDPAEFMKDW